MTKQEILSSLDALKDLTNDNGKKSIDSIKAGVSALTESQRTESPRVEAVDEPEAEPEVKEDHHKAKAKAHR